MPEIRVEAEAYCSCGAGICSNVSLRTDAHRSNMGIIGVIEVEPCKKCLERARQEGFKLQTEKRNHD